MEAISVLKVQPVTEQDFQSEIQKVTNFANTSHAGQIRKGSGLPFIVHPFEVLALVSEWGVGGELIDESVTEDERRGRKLLVWKTALCHDIREERLDIDYEKMVQFLGKQAADVCEELAFLPDNANPLPVPVQKAAYLKSFDRKSVYALVVKCADRIRNTHNFLCDDIDYANKYWKKASSLFDTMFTRGEEITEVLGLDVFPRMKYSKDCTQRMVVR
jgi:(p)ppGpp synthase/HD superfamily hydrolase